MLSLNEKIFANKNLIKLYKLLNQLVCNNSEYVCSDKLTDCIDKAFENYMV